MLTSTELLKHKIDTLKIKSKTLKNYHEWSQWDNWREFTQLDIQIMDLEIELIEIEKQHLKQALEDYKDY